MASGSCLSEHAGSAALALTSPTVAAIATGPSAGGIGIIRLSGSQAWEAARPLAPGVPAAPEPGRVYFSEFVDRDGRLLDRGLLLYFRAPRSFTGEDVVELHAHGAPRLLQLLLRQVLAAPGLVPAGPGEFTRRAFLNGRLDLAQAEAVADLVAAASEGAVRSAAAQARGGLSARVRALREPLVALRADLEGALDFPEEAGAADASAGPRIDEVLAAARALLAESGRGRLLRRGARVVLFGPVNAGKSTLFNRLVGEERTLVDDEPGTTRDAVEVTLEVEGLSLTLVDTAGLRGGEEPGRLEAMGIERTRAALRQADLAVLLVPPGAEPETVARWRAEAEAVPLLRVAGKADLHHAAAGAWAVSGLTGEGVEGLKAELLRRLVGEGVAEAVAVTSERHADALRRAVDSLERAGQAVKLSVTEEVAGELGLACAALGEVTGESAPHELVDSIFSRFCIGK